MSATSGVLEFSMGCCGDFAPFVASFPFENCFNEVCLRSVNRPQPYVNSFMLCNFILRAAIRALAGDGHWCFNTGDVFTNVRVPLQKLLTLHSIRWIRGSLLRSLVPAWYRYNSELIYFMLFRRKLTGNLTKMLHLQIVWIGTAPDLALAVVEGLHNQIIIRVFSPIVLVQTVFICI